MVVKGKSSVRAESLGALEEKFFKDGEDAAAKLFAGAFSYPFERNFYLHRRRGGGEKVRRTDAEGVHNIEYWTFDPPGFWESPYQLMQIEVGPAKPDRFFYHDGEELLIPIKGPEVHYDFFWAPAGKGFPNVYPEEGFTVRMNDAIRIAPRIPHRAWRTRKENNNDMATCWMITRPLANTAGQIYIAWSDRDQNQSSSRQILESEVTEKKKFIPGRYPLLAWGIAETIRLKRQRSNRSVSEVAKTCGINAAHLSRIENASTNASLKTLIKLFRELDIDVANVMTLDAEPANVVQLPGIEEGNASPKPLFSRPSVPISLSKDPIPRRFIDHFIHLQCWHFRAHRDPYEFDARASEWPSTWIVIKGRALIDIDSTVGDWGGLPEILEEESVLHVREKGPYVRRIHALEDTQMLQIIFDPKDCHCDKS
jgi:transcriptional regulator with XRE-family HTH domain